MPYKDPRVRREYSRLWMRKRRKKNVEPCKDVEPNVVEPLQVEDNQASDDLEDIFDEQLGWLDVSLGNEEPGNAGGGNEVIGLGKSGWAKLEGWLVGWFLGCQVVEVEV